VDTLSQQRLEALTKPAEPVAPAAVAAPATARPVSEEELRKADEKLASLLKKQNGGPLSAP
jgi:hypothetical protein